jgi:hypothetical protein
MPPPDQEMSRPSATLASINAETVLRRVSDMSIDVSLVRRQMATMEAHLSAITSHLGIPPPVLPWERDVRPGGQPTAAVPPAASGS